MTFDLLIRGGTVFDGTGAPGVRADVAIRRGQVVAIEPPERLADATAEQTVNAANLYVTPGFIDIHTHSDRSILINPRMESKLRQGVTTEVGGNCGSGVAPAHGEAIPRREPASQDFLSPADQLAKQESQTWPTMAQYFESIENAGIAGNYATWCAHGTLRASTVGYAMRAPDSVELARMQALLRESLEAGAFGLSTGLIYVPSGYADRDELAALTAVMQPYGGVYASHIRGEGATLLESVEEAIEIGQRGGASVQVAHHKAAGHANWGKVHDSLALMDRARLDGIDVACDQYPYVASSTGLSSVLPAWALEGGRDGLMSRLRDPDVRQVIRREVLASRPDLLTLDDEQGWHNILIARCRSDQTAQGRRLGEIAIERGGDPFDVLFDLLLQNDGNVACVFFSMCEPDVRTVMCWAHTMIGSDASSVAPYGALGEGKPHPRAYGAFARVLGHYVRDAGVLTWPEAIHKMTGMPAARLHLKDRGTLAAGQWADVVVFDPESIQDRATFVDPHQYAAGIQHVLVNGVQVIVDGEHTGALPGRVLRRGVDS